MPNYSCEVVERVYYEVTFEAESDAVAAQRARSIQDHADFDPLTTCIAVDDRATWLFNTDTGAEIAFDA
jgi:hypothetical protein